jgi:hypothetical protein
MQPSAKAEAGEAGGSPMVKAEVGESEGRERVKTALQGLVMPTATAWVSIPCVLSL